MLQQKHVGQACLQHIRRREGGMDESKTQFSGIVSVYSTSTDSRSFGTAAGHSIVDPDVVHGGGAAVVHSSLGPQRASSVPPDAPGANLVQRSAAACL